MKNKIIIFCILFGCIINLGCPDRYYPNPLRFQQNYGKDKLRLTIMNNEIDLRLKGSGYLTYGNQQYGIELSLQVRYKDLQGRIDFHIDNIEMIMDDSLTMSKRIIQGAEDFWPEITNNSYENRLDYFVNVDDSLSYQYFDGTEVKLWLGEFITIDDIPVHIDTITILFPCTRNCDEDS